MMLIAAFSSLFATAQSNKAKTILDKTASVIRSAGDIKAVFSAQSSMGKMNGTIYIHKSMLHLQSGEVKCWYDGNTLWTYRKSTNEVNITTPTQAEKQSLNPYLFINLYKRGYNATMKETNLRGKPCYEITLNATSRSTKLTKMVVYIEKKTYYPLKVCMQRSKNNTNIDILQCHTKQKFNERIFKFRKNEYPGVEIIDLR